MITVVTFGTYDLFHVGHLNILRRSKDLGDRLVVGVSSDELNFRKKQLNPTYPLDHRLAIVQSIRYVDEVFVEDAMELMGREQVRRVPIVDERGALVGVVAQADLVRMSGKDRQVEKTVAQISQPGGSHQT